MENRLINIEDIEIGDEILISCQSFFKYLIVLALPKLSKTKVHWTTKQPLYGGVRCSTRRDVITHTYTSHTGVQTSYDRHKWIVSAEGHNKIMSQDLTGRQIWLVKRKEI
jgi:hypothetical protein